MSSYLGNSNGSSENSIPFPASVSLNDVELSTSADSVPTDTDVSAPIPIKKKTPPPMSRSASSPKIRSSSIKVVDGSHPLGTDNQSSDQESLDEFSDDESKNKKSLSASRHKIFRSGRFSELIAGVDDNLEENATVHQVATSLWQNRSKILNNLKKQAADGVKSFKHGAPPENAHKSGGGTALLNDISRSNSGSTKSDGSCSNLKDLDTDQQVVGYKEDDQQPVSFLQGLRGVLSRPQEDDKIKEMKELSSCDRLDTPVGSPRRRSSSSPDSLRKILSSKEEEPKPLLSPTVNNSAADSSFKNTFAMSFSSLLHSSNRKRSDSDVALTYSSSSHHRDDDVTCNNIDDVSTNVAAADDVDHCEKEDVNNNVSASGASLHDSSTDNTANTNTVANQQQSNEIITTCVPSFNILIVLTMCLFLYHVLPVPYSLQIFVRGLVIGAYGLGFFMCLFPPVRPTHRFLPKFENHNFPQQVPKSLYDPALPVKGWLNEISCYDVDAYHVSNTSSVFVTLDGSTMRLQTPLKNISRRSLHKEGNIPVTNVVRQRLFDLTLATVYLKPDGLVKKRVWSKKYPICVKFSPKPPDSPSEIDSDDENDSARKTEADKDVLYLFGRTDRQKEEWFYRIQRQINLSNREMKRKLKEQLAMQQPEGTFDEDEWGVLDDEVGEEGQLKASLSRDGCNLNCNLMVASSLRQADIINEDPMKAYQDFYLHMSRLMPDDDVIKKYKEAAILKEEIGSPKSSSDGETGDNSTSSSSSTDSTPIKEPGIEVAWLNVLLGRITFDFLRQPQWAKWLCIKIQKKLDKIKLPYFIDELKLTEMNLGSSVPLIHQISLPTFNSQGIWVDFDVTYNGSIQMSLQTKLILTKLGKNDEMEAAEDMENEKKRSAILDSEAEDSAESSDEEDNSAVSRIVQNVGQHLRREPSPIPTSPSPPGSSPGSVPSKKWVRVVDRIAKSKYFQKATENEFIRKTLESVSNTALLLGVELMELRGTVRVNIAPPPTDRIWYGFKEPPFMNLKAHPKLGERVVRTTHVTEWIEQKLKQELTKILVIPNMDDIPVPVMFNNRPSTPPE